MEHKIKMVATDIDGTILPYDSDFSENVKTCINKLCEEGIKVVLVTGRMNVSAIPIARQLGLKTPVISYQGGLIKDIDGKILYQAELSPKYAKEVIEWGRKNNVHLNLYMNDKLYVEKDNKEIKFYIQGKFTDYTVTSFDNLELKNINKMLAIDIYDEKRTDWFVEDLSKHFPDLNIVKSQPFFCEICDKNARKSNAVEFLTKYYGLKKEEVLTIGDQNNDIDLINAGGTGIAMGNATEELKKCADYITDTVNNDGFVKAVDKFVWGK